MKWLTNQHLYILIAIIIAFAVISPIAATAEKYAPSKSCIEFCSKYDSPHDRDNCIDVLCESLASREVDPNAPIYYDNNRCNAICDPSSYAILSDECKDCLARKQ